MSKNIPNTVFKYAYYATLEKILENRSIRLNDIQKSNDASELKIASDIIKKVFVEEYEKERTNYLDKYFNIVDFEKFYTENTKYISKIENVIHTQYVASFSQYGDLLSQWRGYEQDGEGFSIGYNANYFPSDDFTNLIELNILKHRKNH